MASSVYAANLAPMVQEWTVIDDAPLSSSYQFTVAGNVDDLILAGTTTSLKSYFTAQLDAVLHTTTFALRPEFATREGLAQLAAMPPITLQAVSGTEVRDIVVTTRQFNSELSQKYATIQAR